MPQLPFTRCFTGTDSCIGFSHNNMNFLYNSLGKEDKVEKHDQILCFRKPNCSSPQVNRKALFVFVVHDSCVGYTGSCLSLSGTIWGFDGTFK